MTTGTRIGASFALALIIIMALGVGAYVNTQRMLEANQWVAHTHQVLEKLQDVLSSQKDAETGQRGYVLTGEERYLEPYNAADRLIQSDIASLNELTSDDPPQQQSLRKVQELSAAKLGELRETIELRRRSGLDAALAVIRTDRGKKIMDDLRAVVAEMQTREQRLLDDRNNAATAIAHRTILTIAIWTPLSLLILTVLAVVVTRKVRFGGPVVAAGTRRGTWRTVALQYSFAVMVIAITAVLRWCLVRAFGPLPLFILLFPAVLLVATIAGGGPGILATALAAVVTTYAFVAPYWSFAIASTNDMLALAIFTGTSLLLCVLAERVRRARWSEAVAEQKQLLSVSLASIGDGVIVSDPQGRVTFLNGEAERLTGWSLQQASNQPLATVFKIINEESRQTVESPVDKVLRLGSIVGLANHTLLIAKDGREFPIDDSGAPIRSGDGTVEGVVLVFRDFTERRRQEQELGRLNRTLKALSSSNRALMRAETESEYLAEVCRIIVEDCGHSMVWVGYAEEDDPRTVRAVASAGFEEGYLQTLNVTRADSERGRGPTGTAIRTGQVSMCRHMQTDPQFAPWREQAIKRGYASSIALPLMSDGKAMGAMTIYAREADPFSDDEVRLLSELASDLAYGVASIRLRLEHARSQELLRQNEEQFRTMADAIPQLAWTAHADGFIYWYNRRWYEYTGTTPRDMEGWGWQSVHDPRVLPKVLEQWRASIATGAPFDMVFPLRGADGVFRPFLTRVQPLKDAHGQVVQWFGTNTDVSELKRAEEAQSLLASIVESSNDAILSKGLDGTILTWNAGAQRLLGYQADEIIGKPITVLLLPELAHEEAQVLDRLRRGERVEHTETIRVAKDGRRIDVSVAVSPLKDRDGHVVGASKIIRDIGERKRAEKALRESEERYRSLFGSLLEGFCIIEVIFDAAEHPIDYRFLEINPAFEAQTGLHNAQGKRMRELAPEHESHWFEIYGKVALTGEPTRFLNEAKALNRWFDVSAYKVGGPESRKVAILFADITERVQAEQGLKRTADELARSNKDLEQFAYVASHDLQEPLRMVTGYLQLIDRRYRDKLDADAREFVAFAVDGATRMSRLITELLDYSRINTRGKPPQLVGMDAVLQRALDNLQVAIRDSGAQISHDPLPTVRGDATQLAQLLQNLVGNAVKFRKPDRPIRVCIAAEKKDDEWVFSIQDNGIGIESQYADKIFLIFQRLHSRGEYPGTGIGLAICKKIVERHAGRIWVQSQLGEGSTFFFTIGSSKASR